MERFTNLTISLSRLIKMNSIKFSRGSYTTPPATIEKTALDVMSSVKTDETRGANLNILKSRTVQTPWFRRFDYHRDYLLIRMQVRNSGS